MTVQRLVIQSWHPTMSANGAHGHPMTQYKKHKADMIMAWASAKQAGWVFVPGKVRLTITLVYPRNTLPDADNAVAKCKGLIDGLRDHPHTVAVANKSRMRLTIPMPGFFIGDDTEHLDLVVRAEVERGVKAVRIELEPAAGVDNVPESAETIAR